MMYGSLFCVVALFESEAPGLPEGGVDCCAGVQLEKSSSKKSKSSTQRLIVGLGCTKLG